MKRIYQVLISLTCAAALICSATVMASAHSGRTDGNGGHKDNKNKSGLGSYHYHCGGYPPHLHSGGYCPYTESPPAKTTTNSSSANTVKKVAAEKVAVSSSSYTNTVYIGGTIQLNASVTPADAENKSVTWTSSDENIATINKSGLVTTYAPGEVTFTATTSNGVAGKFILNVQEKVVEKVEILEDDFTLLTGTSLDLNAEITPADASHPEITWTTSDAAIVEVSGNGLVSAIDGGMATITATSVNGLSDSVIVEVTERIAVEQIEITSSLGNSLKIGDVSELTAEVYPADATYPDITWETNDTTIAIIDENGTLEALSDGQVIITARSEDGFEETLAIEIASESSLVPLGGLAVVGASGLALLKRKHR